MDKFEENENRRKRKEAERAKEARDTSKDPQFRLVPIAQGAPVVIHPPKGEK